MRRMIDQDKGMPPAGADAPPADPFDDEDEAEEAQALQDLALEGLATDLDPETEAEPGTIARGRAVIADLVRRLPLGPGVYRMIDGAGEVLYVGKARSLKKRVGSYVRQAGHPARILRMIAATAAMEFVSTHTETEALLLEANLIKRLRPRFNVLMRDDKSFPYILISDDHPAPQIAKHRGARSRKGHYYGPFASAGAVNRTINALERAFLLRSCSDSMFESRTRPCLLFQIKRCAAPCTGEIGTEAYRALVDQARDFLSGKSAEVRVRLGEAMHRAAENLAFETAARYRDRLAALAAIQAGQGINPHGVEEADVFAVAQDGGLACIEVFFFRTGQNWGNRAYFPRADKALSPAEILGSFLAQFYDDKPAPRLILLSEEVPEQALLTEALSERSGFRVEIATPKRGEKRALVEDVLINARGAVGRKLADTKSQAQLLEGVQRVFGLPAPPRRIEIYDNSHIMGTNAVGAMVVAGPEGLMKRAYRTFNIRSADLVPGDDYGMMREVLKRRFTRLAKDAAFSGEEGPAKPDLVLIDGGAGQLTAARETLAELGVDDVPLVGIAKGPDRDAGREKFFQAGKPSFMLPERDPVLYYVQRLRDEAHRFAIGTHRAKRKKDIARNPLDEVAGIGPTRKRALLTHFGTVKAVSRASLADLMRTPGVNESTAKAVYDFFHENG